MTTTAVIIPARYDSTRLPGKALTEINGKPMIEWVVNAANRSKLRDKIIVATDDTRIFDFVKQKFSLHKHIEPFMTSKEHKCGTDRIAEVIKCQSGIKYIVNLQGDEPLMPPEYIDKVLEPLLKGKATMTSLIAPITNLEDLNNPNIVKTVIDKNNNALYFSRSPIPYDRNPAQSSTLLPKTWFSKGSNPHRYFKHIGIYGYTRDTILQFSLLPQSSLELIEQLEQLRAIENGIKVKLEIVPRAYPAVDSPEDIKIVEEIFQPT